MLREHDIKMALIVRLHQKGMLDNAVLINEMVVAKWSRRADLALVNETLQAFEIKSDYDSLKRLDGQLATFNSRFEKVTVVCASKFTIEVLNKVPREVEVLEVSKNDDSVSFKIVQRGKTRNLKDKKILLSFLLKKEIRALLKGRTVSDVVDLNRELMEVECLKLPVSVIRNFVLCTVKSRYRETSNRLIEKLDGPSVLLNADLHLLSKKKLARSSEFKELKFRDFDSFLGSAGIIKLDFSQLKMKYGEVLVTAPSFAIKRLVKNKVSEVI
ncbi:MULTISPECIES: sce7726 family protein [Pseudomonas]|uniref:sce7726 family protein n=1 Tax=Pseudomonas TaxID=286 RepID=UPI000DAC9901|nr:MULTISPECIES: sce7726 family protein [Pseudomonas]MCA5974450.1 sce7726 family protein [Pseudomonas sp. P135]MCH5536559.1 sce7726 family protein [Pseudomonas syringae pv. syringae]MCH5570863.1 sce7726 family protein [Pseudomonas syringae pv. syringae]